MEFRSRRLAKLEAAHIGRNADYLKPHRLLVRVSISKRDSLTDGALTGKHCLREFLVDDHHKRRILSVALGVSAALDQRNTHRAKVIRADHAIIRARPLVGSRHRTSLNAEPGGWPFVQRQRIDDAD